MLLCSTFILADSCDCLSFHTRSYFGEFGVLSVLIVVTVDNLDVSETLDRLDSIALVNNPLLITTDRFQL